MIYDTYAGQTKLLSNVKKALGLVFILSQQNTSCREVQTGDNTETFIRGQRTNVTHMTLYYIRLFLQICFF